jgi:Kef-type K+ transport system membrane component KefB
MSTTEIFLVAMLIIFSLPYLVWRLLKTDYWAPLVVVQIIGGILLGPGVLGAAFPAYYDFVFSPPVVQSLNGVAWWAVMLFVWIAGIELDLRQAWARRARNRRHRRPGAGRAAAAGLRRGAGPGAHGGLDGAQAQAWQFVLGVGMACAVTALPILILLMEKLAILRLPLGQRILRYASLDDIAIWGVLALILLDWTRVGKQAGFLALFFVAIGWAFRALMRRVPERDRWYLGLIWLAACALGADWAGLHFMVGAFLAGAVMDADWFDQAQMDLLRHHVLLVVMPVFFLSTGLRTRWDVGGVAVFVAAAWLLAAAVAGKLLAAHLAGRILGWAQGEASPHRLAAADQGADHDHLCQHPAGQAGHHQRHLHRAAADGGGQHHADGAHGHAQAQAPGHHRLTRRKTVFHRGCPR